MAESLAHSKWVCKYHVVFTPKYRRKIDYWGMKEDIRDLWKWKGVGIIEGHVMPDHIHLLLSIPPKYSVSSFMGYLKGKSAMMIYERHANLKYKFGNRHFWATGYYAQRKKRKRAIEYEALTEMIKDILHENNGRYGAKRIQLVLGQQGC